MDILLGIKFALDHHLTSREMLILYTLGKKSQTAKSIANVTEIGVKNVHHLIKILRLRGIVEMKAKTDKREMIYGVKDLEKL